MAEIYSPGQEQYPRPDFERPNLSWCSLNGEWNFTFDDEDVGELNLWHIHKLPHDNLRTINVPFVYQTKASGINERGAHPIVWYEKSINNIRQLEQKQGDRVLLRFGAIDYEAKVWIDGLFVGSHRGGHVPFDLDVTDFVSGGESSRVTIRVWDSVSDLTQPRGKQYWKPNPESIFYTPSTGIWQSVWLEIVPQTRIADSSHGTIIRSNNIRSGELETEIAIISRRKNAAFTVTINASLDGVEVAKSDGVDVDRETDIARVKLSLRLSGDQQRRLSKAFMEAHPLSDTACWHDGLALWSPEYPILYDLTISLIDSESQTVDTVACTTGMRSITWTNGDNTFRLNNQPYFQALVLDQGYWPSTNITPPTPQALKDDIILSKAMGFNGCRKHQKVEDPMFLYWADKLGYLVWGEIANAYDFSTQYVDRFDQEWMEAVRRDINHPCIVTWTPINETWGYTALGSNATEQNHVRSLYYRTKTLDPTRPINDNCGWEHVCTDLTTFHDYSDGPDLAKTCQSLEEILKPKAGKDMFVGDSSHRHDAPVICTEFGGVNIAPRQDETAIEGSWGYTTATDAQDLLQRVRRLMLGVVEGGLCCGFVYTQL